MTKYEAVLVFAVLACIVSCGQTEDAEQTAESGQQSRVSSDADPHGYENHDDYIVDDAGIDKILIVGGVTFAVFPDWTIVTDKESVTLRSVEDELVFVKFTFLGSNRISELIDVSRLNETINLAGLDEQLTFLMDNDDMSHVVLTGYATLSDNEFASYLIVEGELSEVDKAHRQLAGQLWKMIHWVHIDSEYFGQGSR